ncbi:family 16 glycosylhydrolase [Litoribacter alkaliphilus]|uniref:Family 16 glycosylhydrolase n=2 Tax=Litoribacter ruber TaxID=702568 RepID=A0AAP2G4Y0_9BACT|nr:family 16 glycosylhydrolase [Litoribacter alkaliphilus]
MKKRMKFILIMFILLTGANSCQQEQSGEVVTLPTDLTVQIEELGNGRVKAIFSARDVNFYRIDFGEAKSNMQRVEGQEATHSYRTPGNYTITVQAHTTEDAFISEETQVEITEQALGLGIPTEGYESPESYDGYTLVWRDEFEEGISPDWVYEIGDGCPNLCGWGNNELQFYRRENAEVKDGMLVITAKEENFGGKNYTSTRMKTQGKQSFTFGRIDFRAVLPKGQGIWPAFWMLGESITEVGWPACGEIDIMEMVGGNASGRDNTTHGTLHWSNNGTYATSGGKSSLSEGIFNDAFHVFSIIWDEEKIVWLLDGQEYHTIDITPAHMDEFRDPQFILINLAIGGNWPGNPDDSTIFPQQLVVDYVRVFQKD